MRSTVKCAAWRSREAVRIAARRLGSRSSSMTAPGERVRVARRDQQARLRHDRLARPADGGDDLRHAARQRLERADRERLPARGEHVDVELAQVVGGRRPIRLPAHAARPRDAPAARLAAARRRRSRSRASGTAARIAGTASSSTSTPFPRRSAETVPTIEPPGASLGRARRTAASRCGPPRACRGCSWFARARSRSKAQTPMIAAVGGASTRSTTCANTRRASRISPTNGKPCGV